MILMDFFFCFVWFVLHFSLVCLVFLFVFGLFFVLFFCLGLFFVLFCSKVLAKKVDIMVIQVPSSSSSKKKR